jgi:type VI secretion system secreted protein VgrG
MITGRVYNAETLPPYELPAGRARTTLQTLSYPGGDGFNELRFDDAKEQEQIFIHAQRNFDLRVRNDQFTTVLSDSHSTIGKDLLIKVGGDQHATVVGDQNLKVGGTVSVEAGADWQQRVGANLGIQARSEVHLKAGMNVVIESGVTLTLKVGGNFININPEGIVIKGNLVMINSGGAAGTGAGVLPAVPKTPQEADSANSGTTGELPKPERPPRPVHWSPQALTMKRAHGNGTPFCELCEKRKRDGEIKR